MLKSVLKVDHRATRLLMVTVEIAVFALALWEVGFFSWCREVYVVSAAREVTGMNPAAILIPLGPATFRAGDYMAARGILLVAAAVCLFVFAKAMGAMLFRRLHGEGES